MQGPMFQPARDEFRTSVHGAEGGHYNVFSVRAGRALDFLKKWFPTGDEPNDMNLVFFSTSGVHGSYATIEQVEENLRSSEEELLREVTFLVVQPRIVSMTYGNVTVSSDEDVAYLKRLRAASWAAAQKIGAK